MNAVVTVKSIKVFGDSKEYPADEVTMKKFVKWAMETKADLRAHPMLNEQLRVLDQCITTEAMTVLWACTALQQAGVPRAYPSEAVKSAVTQANLRARCDFHITWLTDIVAACAPNTNAHIIKEIEKIKFGEGATGGITGRFYQEEDVTRYMGKLLQLQRERGDPMRTGLTNKVKLDVVKRALPTVGLKSLLESTLPTGTAPADDSWEEALPRLAKELKKSEDRALLGQSITLKENSRSFLHAIIRARASSVYRASDSVKTMPTATSVLNAPSRRDASRSSDASSSVTIGTTRAGAVSANALSSANHRQTRTSNVSTAARRGITPTSALSRRRIRRRAVDAVETRADAADAVEDEIRSRSPARTSRTSRPDGARGSSGTQVRVNLAVRTSPAGRYQRPKSTA